MSDSSNFTCNPIAQCLTSPFSLFIETTIVAYTFAKQVNIAIEADFMM